jgi:copper oxidase (laccase) domain-containing protein
VLQPRRRLIDIHTDDCAYLLFNQLDAAPAVAHGVFTRQGGFSGPPFNGLNCSITVGDTREAVHRNYAVIMREVGLPLLSARIEHGNAVTVVERAHPGSRWTTCAPACARRPPTRW